MDKQVAIAHELGHVVLHYENAVLKSSSTSEIKGEESELQATYFAENVILHRSNQFRDSTFIEKHRYEKTTVLNTIRKVYPKYDEHLID